MIVYFDTNIFDHLEQLNGVNEWDLFRVRRAVRHECIRVVLSYLNIEETLFIVPSQPKRAEARVKLIFELGDKHLVVRETKSILNDEIRAYSRGLPIVSPFESLTCWMESELWSLAAPVGTRKKKDLDRLLKTTHRIKMEYQSFMNWARGETEIMSRTLVGGRYPFQAFLKDNSAWLAEGLAKRAKALLKVRRQGIQGLLELKSVALAVGANFSLIYSHQFEGRTPASGDSRDVLHSVAASSADVFVTNDRKLATILSRIPVQGFRVMNLTDFLNSLPQWV